MLASDIIPVITPMPLRKGLTLNVNADVAGRIGRR